MYARILPRASLRNVSSVSGNVGRLASNRHYSSTMHDNDPEFLEKEKRRNVSATQHETSPIEHAPGWNENLATASEAAVKADRAAGTPAELQQTTVTYVRQRYKDETAEDEIVEDRTKVSTSGPLYTNGKEKFHHNAVVDELSVGREEIKGPLRSALGKEDGGERMNTRRHFKKIVSEDSFRTASEQNVKADGGI